VKQMLAYAKDGLIDQSEALEIIDAANASRGHKSRRDPSLVAYPQEVANLQEYKIKIRINK